MFRIDLLVVRDKLFNGWNQPLGFCSVHAVSRDIFTWLLVKQFHCRSCQQTPNGRHLNRCSSTQPWRLEFREMASLYQFYIMHCLLDALTSGASVFIVNFRRCQWCRSQIYPAVQLHGVDKWAGAITVHSVVAPSGELRGKVRYGVLCSVTTNNCVIHAWAVQKWSISLEALYKCPATFRAELVEFNVPLDT